MSMRLTTLFWLTVILLSCQLPACAAVLRQPLAEAAAREVRTPHPPGCLDAWPVEQNLEGRLLGIVLGAFPDEHPPVPARAFLFLLLNHPIAMCASPKLFYPAYTDVTRVAISNLSLQDFLYVMRAWGPDQIRIKSTLNSANTTGEEPGPVIFDTANFNFCWRQSSRGKRRSWKCVNSEEWSKMLPGPRLR
jgi:hypothetical protein